MTNLFDPDEEYASILNRHLYERSTLVHDNSEQLRLIFLKHRKRLGSLKTNDAPVVTLIRQRAQEEFMEIERQQKTLNMLILKHIEEISEFIKILSVSYPGYCMETNNFPVADYQ